MAAIPTASIATGYDAAAVDPSGQVNYSSGAPGEQAILDAVRAELARRQKDESGSGDAAPVVGDLGGSFAPASPSASVSTPRPSTGFGADPSAASPTFPWSPAGGDGADALSFLSSLFTGYRPTPSIARMTGQPASIADLFGDGADGAGGGNPSGDAGSALDNSMSARGNPTGLGPLASGYGFSVGPFGNVSFSLPNSPVALNLSPFGTVAPSVRTGDAYTGFALNNFVGQVAKAIGVPVSVNLLTALVPSLGPLLGAMAGPFGLVAGTFPLAVQMAEQLAAHFGVTTNAKDISNLAQAIAVEQNPDENPQGAFTSPVSQDSVQTAMQSLAQNGFISNATLANNPGLQATLGSIYSAGLTGTGGSPSAGPGLASVPGGYAPNPTGPQIDAVTGQVATVTGAATGNAPNNSTNFSGRGGDADPSGPPTGVGPPGQDDGGMGGTPSGAAPSGAGPSGAGPGGAAAGTGAPADGGVGGSPSSGAGDGGGGGGGGGSCSLMSFAVQQLKPADAAQAQRFMRDFYTMFMRKNPQEAQRLFALYQQSARGIIRAATQKQQQRQVATFIYEHLVRPFGHRLEPRELAPAVHHMAVVVKTLLEHYGLPVPAAPNYGGQALGGGPRFARAQKGAA